MTEYEYYAIIGYSMDHPPADCHSTDGHVLGVISAFVSEGIDPTNADIARRIRASERTVRRSIKALRDKGHLQKIETGYIVPDEYRLETLVSPAAFDAIKRAA